MVPNNSNPIELSLDRDVIFKIIGELYVNKLLLEQKIIELQSTKKASIPELGPEELRELARMK